MIEAKIDQSCNGLCGLQRKDLWICAFLTMQKVALKKVRLAPILLKKSKVEWLQSSRECQFLVVSAARSLCRTCTKVTGRFCANRCGPSRRRVSDAPAGLKNFAHELKGTFSTISARSGHSANCACRLGGLRHQLAPSGPARES